MSRSPVSERLSPLAIFMAMLAPVACGGLEHEHEPPPETFSESKTAGGSTPNPNALTPEDQASEATISEVIVDCERHIRAWQFARANAQTQREMEQLEVLREAFAYYVANEMDLIREIALIGEPRARGVASTALGFSGDPSVLAILLNNVGDPDGDIVANTLFGLGMLAAPETPGRSLNDAVRRSDATLEMMRNGVYAAARVAQARSKDEERGQRADGLEDALLFLIERPEPGIRAQAASGLGYAHASNAIPALTNLLVGDSDPNVRLASAFALGEIGEANSASALISALDDPVASVAGAARGALAKMFGQDNGPDPKAWEPMLRD